MAIVYGFHGMLDRTPALRAPVYVKRDQARDPDCATWLPLCIREIKGHGFLVLDETDLGIPRVRDLVGWTLGRYRWCGDEMGEYTVLYVSTKDAKKLKTAIAAYARERIVEYAWRLQRAAGSKQEVFDAAAVLRAVGERGAAETVEQAISGR